MINVQIAIDVLELSYRLGDASIACAAQHVINHYYYGEPVTQGEVDSVMNYDAPPSE